MFCELLIGSFTLVILINRIEFWLPLQWKIQKYKRREKRYRLFISPTKKARVSCRWASWWETSDGWGKESCFEQRILKVSHRRVACTGRARVAASPSRCLLLRWPRKLSGRPSGWSNLRSAGCFERLFHWTGRLRRLILFEIGGYLIASEKDSVCKYRSNVGNWLQIGFFFRKSDFFA